MAEEIKYKIKKWFRASPLRNGVILESMLENREEFELNPKDILSVRGERGDKYLVYTETGLMLGGYVDKNNVRKLTKEESKKVELVMVPPYISAKW